MSGSLRRGAHVGVWGPLRLASPILIALIDNTLDTICKSMQIMCATQWLGKRAGYYIKYNRARSHTLL